MAAARINQREKCALITENRGSGELRSPHSARSDSKSWKVPPEFANGGNEAHGDARNRGSSGEYRINLSLATCVFVSTVFDVHAGIEET